MSQAKINTIESIEQERLRKRKLSEVASQDSALFRLLGSSLAPYKKWLAISMVLMLVTSGLNAVPPYLLQQAIDGPIARWGCQCADTDYHAIWRNRHRPLYLYLCL